jgi:carboxymethylenebutenolidase
MLDAGIAEESSMDDASASSGLRRYPLARRGLMMSSLISGFTLATARVDAQAIHTSSEGLSVGEAHVPVTGGDMPVYYARPASGGPFPIVLVNEEIFGVHEYIQDVCRRLAHAGYLAVAPEIYFRSPGFAQMTDSQQIMRDVIFKTPDAEIWSDLDATLAWAAKNHGNAARMGEMGFCFGGRNTWLYAAHNPNLKAAVAYYGHIKNPTSPIKPQTVLDIAGQIHCPLLGLYGGQDASNPADLVREAAAKAKAAGKTVEIVIYPDAPHGFHADYRPSYREADAKDAWNRTLAWFSNYLGH